MELEAIHYAAGVGSMLVAVIGLEIGQYKIMLETRSTAETAADRTERLDGRLDDVEKDIDGMAATVVRYTEAEFPALPDGGTEDVDDDGGEI